MHHTPKKRLSSKITFAQVAAAAAVRYVEGNLNANRGSVGSLMCEKLVCASEAAAEVPKTCNFHINQRPSERERRTNSAIQLENDNFS
jgi:hypothetical protein